MTSRSATPPPSAAVMFAVGAFIVLVAGSVALTDPGGVALTVSYALAGAILVARRPSQPIGWLLLVMALGMVLGTTRVRASADELRTGTASLLGTLSAWANGTGWTAVFGGFIGILLLFPRGTLRAPWERSIALAIAVLYVPLVVVLLFGPTVSVTMGGAVATGVPVPNPLALAPVVAVTGPAVDPETVWPLLFAPLLIGILAFVWRFWRSTGLERLQFRWLAWAVVWVGIASVAWAILTNLLPMDALVAFMIVLVSYPLIPMAITVAVLRYRLYEIDRLVSRTLGWGLATASVIGLFVVAVLALQAALAGFTQGQTLATAASTLLAFAAFQPIRRRVQAIIDRRFDRPRVEAERSLAEHGDRMQHEVDLVTLTRDVEDTIHASLRPASAAVWIRRS